ncbi:MAG: hypothetical protein AB7I40_06585 [Nocardioides sp.]|uniref:hypothetical protein n=2 Tax=Nocardioides sp. TaxID=35761 RepID=UPI003D0DF247
MPDGRNAGEVYERLMATLVNEEVGSLMRPHIVVCSSRDTAMVCYSGPYPDGLSALIAAERDARQVFDDLDLHFQVSPLLPP